MHKSVLELSPIHGMFAGVYWLKKRGEEGEGV
jgi:hypothetical protein